MSTGMENMIKDFGRFLEKKSQITFIEAALFVMGICSIGLRLQHATDKFSILLHHVLSDAILGLCFITMFKKKLSISGITSSPVPLQHKFNIPFDTGIKT